MVDSQGWHLGETLDASGRTACFTEWETKARWVGDAVKAVPTLTLHPYSYSSPSLQKSQEYTLTTAGETLQTRKVFPVSPPPATAMSVSHPTGSGPQQSARISEQKGTCVHCASVSISVTKSVCSSSICSLIHPAGDYWGSHTDPAQFQLLGFCNGPTR